MLDEPVCPFARLPSFLITLCLAGYFSHRHDRLARCCRHGHTPAAARFCTRTATRCSCRWACGPAPPGSRVSIRRQSTKRRSSLSARRGFAWVPAGPAEWTATPCMCAGSMRHRMPTPPCRSHADVAPALQASRREYFPVIHARPDDVPPAASSQPRKPRDCCAAHNQPSSMKAAISPEN